MTSRGARPSPHFAVLFAAGLLALGSLGPWESSLTDSRPGIEGAGLYTLLIALIAGLLAIPKRPWPTVVAAMGSLSLLITVISLVGIASSIREPVGLESAAVELDWGLWVSLLASGGLAVAGLALRRDLPGTRDDAPSRPKQGWIRENPGLFGLFVLLGAGLILRIWLMTAWTPAFVNYSDSGIYFQGAFESVWADPIRMAGYSMFLKAIHTVVPYLSAAIVVQHLMGLGAAALAFFAVRRCGGPWWVGLIPAAVLAVGGDQLIIEHAALSEALFVFLVALTLYATVRASDGRLWWAAAAGVAAGLAVWGRTAGLGLAVVISVWLAFSAGWPTRRTLVIGSLCLVVSLATVGVYAGWRSLAVDMPGTLTSNNAWNLYGRVASWADCSEFEPPVGTEGLCQQRPASERGYRSGEDYIFSPDSPAQRLFGPPYRLSDDPTAMVRLQEWSMAALRGQPLDYARSVLLDVRRLFTPNSPSYSQLSADGYLGFLIYGAGRDGRNEFVEYWQSLLYPDDPPAHKGNIEPFVTWEAMTRIVNFWMALMLGLSLVGLVTLRGRPRAGVALFGSVALLLLLFPIASKGYDYRFTIPAFAPLAAAAALGVWGLAGLVLRGRPQSAPQAQGSTVDAAPGSDGPGREP